MLTLPLAVRLLILGLAMLILRLAVGLLLARPLGLAMLIMLLIRRVFGPGVLGRREASHRADHVSGTHDVSRRFFQTTFSRLRLASEPSGYLGSAV